jgi:hypothetical protein
VVAAVLQLAAFARNKQKSDRRKEKRRIDKMEGEVKKQKKPRKERKADFVPKKNTIFVKGLSEGCTNIELEELFQEIGPLKRCFVVKHKGGTKCRGFGYVSFALEEDAKAAIKKFNGQQYKRNILGVALAKPRMKKEEEGGEVVEAGSKAALEEQAEIPGNTETAKEQELEVEEAQEEVEEEVKDAKVKEGKKKRGKSESSSKKTKEQRKQERTLIIVGFNKFTSIEAVKVKLNTILQRAYNKSLSVVSAAIDSNSYDHRAAIVVCKHSTHSRSIMKRLQGRTWDGCKIQVAFLNDLPQYRLIVRNLHFGVTQQQLTESFSK